MKRSKMFAVALAFTCTLAAQERGNWRAVSSNARAITSDISLAAEKIQIGFTAFPISWIRPLQPAELKAAFVFDGDSAGTGSLYKLNIPATQKFLKKNSLCGADDTQWMVSYLAGRELQIAFFSGSKVPDLTPEAIANTTNLCGVYTYVK